MHVVKNENIEFLFVFYYVLCLWSVIYGHINVYCILTCDIFYNVYTTYIRIEQRILIGSTKLFNAL